ncbi:MAG: LTA synthase family protein [Selenomonas sp.]|nr:LTA synthase family protein [Selenomonas sp.]MCI6231696.1 LTA synthase family protein [Selenomonas sp.]
MRQQAFFAWERFDELLRKGLKVWVFYLAVLFFCRLFFLWWMKEYMGAGTETADIWAAIVRGGRLSCQTAGVLTAVALVPGALLHYVFPRIENVCWKAVLGVELLVTSILYVASFPYYRQFHANFNQLMFNAANDDMVALFWSLVQEFYLPVRLAVACLLAFVLWKAAVAFVLRWQGPRLTFVADFPWPVRWAVRACALGVCYIVGLLSVFGGSLGWETGVDWENAGVTKDDFLNEIILDSYQAVHRGYVLQNRMLACNGLDFTVEDIRALAALHAGMEPTSDDLDTYLRHEAAGAGLGAKPSHVFIILSESYANWPLLDKYKDLHIADGMRSVIAEDDSDYCPTFLPNGASTVSAVTGVVTGFADANLYLTTMPESFAAPYPTASAPQFARLGYTTNFWYAGPATWERIGAFTQAQGFEHFYSRGDYGDVPGSVWGCEDEVLYEKVLSGLAAAGDVPSYNVILNASNHSPYDVDVDEKGFDREQVRAALPVEAQNDEHLLKELGHYWYADRELTKFIRDAKAKYPDSLFVIVGDHGDRYNIDKTPTTYERYGIPFVITGQGVHKGTLLADSAGSQIDIVPTLLELIAPKGFEYMSLGTSLTTGSRQGVNYGFWITRHAIGKADTVPLVEEPIEDDMQPIDQQAMQDYINAIRSVSWWRAKYGAVLDAAKLEGRE